MSRESEEKYRQVVSTTKDPIMVFDAETKQFIEVNKACEDLYGYSREEFLCLKHGEITAEPEASDDAMKETVEEVFKRIPLRYHKKKDGTIFPVEISGSSFIQKGRRVLCEVVRDITERIQIEMALHEEKNRAQRYLDVANVVLLSLDADGNVILINKMGCEVLGYEERDITGKNWFDHFIPERMRSEAGAVHRGLMDGKVESFKYCEIPILTKAYEERIIAWHNNVLTDRAGNITGTLSSGEDITERKHLENQLLHSQKMEAVGLLAGGVAHDFNNILTAIKSYGYLLQMKLGENDPLREYANQIVSASERAANLTHSLLAFSRKQIISPKRIELNEIVRRIEKLLPRLIGEDIELRANLMDENLYIMADMGQIEQVLMNLATNARDAMPDGGILTVSAGSVKIDREFIKAHGFGRRGMYALLTVADTGMGMDEKTRNAAFEPFFTTKEVGKGTGLGLSMAYGIIKQHDGYIHVCSKLKKGTTFQIYLPQIESDPREMSSTVSSSLKRRGTETVLVGEDDPKVREPIKTVLNSFGYKVIEAVDGKDVIEKYKENQEDIHLVLLDVIMPQKNGNEVYHAIKAINPDTKIIFMSGYTADFIHDKGIVEKEIELISKPVSPNDLLHKIRAVLDNNLLSDTTPSLC